MIIKLYIEKQEKDKLKKRIEELEKEGKGSSSQKESELQKEIENLKLEIKNLNLGSTNVTNSDFEKLKKINEQLNKELNALRKMVVEIKEDDVEKGKLIGSGGFGTIYKGAWNGNVVALKQMALALNSKTQQEFDYEAGLLKRLEHPNIIRLYGVVKPKNENPMMVLEYYEQGSLYHLLYESNPKIVLSLKKKLILHLMLEMD